MQPIELIAAAIRRERVKAGLSLSALAEQAELAKSTLSQLEAGKGNPSVETLWAIANALGVPFSFLFETASIQSELIRAAEGAAVISEEAKFTVQLMSQCPPAARRDLYRVHLVKGEVRNAEAHPAGTIEHVFVCMGQVSTGPVEEKEELLPGDYYRFPADKDHVYEALTDRAMILVIMESVR